jgi:hypothetical protein
MSKLLGSYNFSAQEIKDSCQSISSGGGHMLHNFAINLVNRQGLVNGTMSAHISSHLLNGQHHYHGHYHYYFKRDNVRGIFPIAGVVSDPSNVVTDAVSPGKILRATKLNNLQQLKPLSVGNAVVAENGLKIIKNAYSLPSSSPSTRGSTSGHSWSIGDIILFG